jgi:Clostripain family
MRKWTILVFMAADNDLDMAAQKDIHEMERLGSSDEVAIVVQVDRRGDGEDGAARRGLVTRNPGWQRFDFKLASDLVSIGETNTGDPSVLTDFIVWGVQTFPAERYALVIWNHGSGWKPEFIYAAAEQCAGEDVAVAMRTTDFASQFAKKARRCLFRPTLNRRLDRFIHDTLLPNLPTRAGGELPAAGTHDELREGLGRAICLDETSHDAFDSLELTAAFDAAWARLEASGTPRVRFSLLGFDACLMAGIEVAYELRDVATFIVGSEEIEPAVGWRYDLLLETLAQQGGQISDEALARAIVDNYIHGLADYKIRLVTQSVLRTADLPALAASLEELAAAMAPMVDSRYAKLAHAEKTATRFFDTDYLDIGDYLARVATLDGDPAYGDVLRRAQSAYQSGVVYSRFDFPREGQRPTGLSVYYPTKPMFDDSYRSLALSRVMPGWVELVRRYHFLT